MFLISHDNDGFSRWNAGQQLAVQIMQELIQRYQRDQSLQLDGHLIQAFRAVLQGALDDPGLDKAMVSQLLVLPTEAYLSELSAVIDVKAIHHVREFVRKALGQSLAQLFAQNYQANLSDESYQVSAGAIAQRSLKNTCLGYLMLVDENQWIEYCETQFYTANNMTDVSAGLKLLVNSAAEAVNEIKIKALQDFYQQWQHEPLVVDQWFSVQATCLLPDTLDRVTALMQHQAFDIKNPNKVRALIGAFCGQNAIGFHCESGEGYGFLADQVITLNRLNPQIASRLLTPLTRWQKYDSQRQQLMQQELQRIKSSGDLSKDVFEVVSTSLAVCIVLTDFDKVNPRFRSWITKVP